MSEGVKEKTPRKRGSLFFGVDESATSTSHRHQIGDQVPNHDGDDDEDYRDDDIDPLITPEAQRTGFLPPTRRPVTRSQTKRRRLDTSGASDTPFAWDRAGDDAVDHPLTGGLRLPGSSRFSFRIRTSISVSGEVDDNQAADGEEYESVSIDASGSLIAKRKRSSVADEFAQSVSRGTRVPLKGLPSIEPEDLRDKTYRPPSSRVARKRDAHQTGSQAPRRSLRLQLITPATSMERVFSSLPPELQVAFWQTAASFLAPSLRRVVYIRNAVSRTYSQGGLNPLPPLFHVSVEARKAIMKHYRKMFARIITVALGDHSYMRHLISAASVVDSASSARPGVDPSLFPPVGDPPGPAPSAADIAAADAYNGAIAALRNAPPGISLPNVARRGGGGASQQSESLDFSSYQFVNPESDIIAFEPCCSGCRAYHCARKQFREDDRAAVRFLALRNEAENLAPATRPAWATMAAAWPNVETLYLITNLAGHGAVNWNRRGGEWALIRVEKEGPHEVLLRQRFDQWKAAEGPLGGQASKVSTLEFVALVPRVRKSATGTSVGGLYSSVERMVADGDVIVG